MSESDLLGARACFIMFVFSATVPSVHGAFSGSGQGALVMDVEYLGFGRRFWIQQREFALRYTILMHNEDTRPPRNRSSSGNLRMNLLVSLKVGQAVSSQEYQPV